MYNEDRIPGQFTPDFQQLALPIEVHPHQETEAMLPPQEGDPAVEWSSPLELMDHLIEESEPLPIPPQAANEAATKAEVTTWLEELAQAHADSLAQRLDPKWDGKNPIATIEAWAIQHPRKARLAALLGRKVFAASLPVVTVVNKVKTQKLVREAAAREHVVQYGGIMPNPEEPVAAHPADLMPFEHGRIPYAVEWYKPSASSADAYDLPEAAADEPVRHEPTTTDTSGPNTFAEEVALRRRLFVRYLAERVLGSGMVSEVDMITAYASAKYPRITRAAAAAGALIGSASPFKLSALEYNHRAIHPTEWYTGPDHDAVS